jgi:hypothetical protein
MLKIITVIISIISSVVGFFKKKTPDEERLKYDKLLADAIKRGDAEEVARIRERWKHYSGLVILVMSILLVSGCGIFRPAYKDIPLTGGMIPYELKPGIYEDTQGKMHKEDEPRWSLSREDLFRDTQQLAEKATESKFNTTLTKIGTYTKEYTIYFIAVLLIYIVVKRKP